MQNNTIRKIKNINNINLFCKMLTLIFLSKYVICACNEQKKNLFDFNLEVFINDQNVKKENAKVKEIGIDDFNEELKIICFEKKDLIYDFFKCRKNPLFESNKICSTMIEAFLNSFYETDKKIEEITLIEELHNKNTYMRSWIFIMENLHRIIHLKLLPPMHDNLYDPAQIQDGNSVRKLFDIVNIFHSTIPQEIILLLWRDFKSKLLIYSHKLVRPVYNRCEYFRVLTMENLSNSDILMKDASKLNGILNLLDNENKICKFIFEINFDFEHYNRCVISSDSNQETLNIKNLNQLIPLKSPFLLKNILQNLFLLLNNINFGDRSTVEVKLNVKKILIDIDAILKDNPKRKDYSIKSIHNILAGFSKILCSYLIRFVRIKKYFLNFIEFKIITQNIFKTSKLFRTDNGSKIDLMEKEIKKQVDIFKKMEKKTKKEIWICIFGPITRFYKKVCCDSNPLYIKRWNETVKKFLDEYDYEFLEANFFSIFWYTNCFYDALDRARFDKSYNRSILLKRKSNDVVTENPILHKILNSRSM